MMERGGLCYTLWVLLAVHPGLLANKSQTGSIQVLRLGVNALSTRGASSNQ